jgi:hypothetical protein
MKPCAYDPANVEHLIADLSTKRECSVCHSLFEPGEHYKRVTWDNVAGVVVSFYHWIGCSEKAESSGEDWLHENCSGDPKNIEAAVDFVKKLQGD